MTYATQQDLINRFGTVEVTELSDRDNTGAINAAIVAQALADADAMINGYVASRYTLPLSTVPAEINRLACDVARYFLSQRPTEEVRTRYEDARAWLAQVAKGTFGLGISNDQAATPAAPAGGPQVSQGADRQFTQDSLQGFARPFGVRNGTRFP